MSSNRTPSGNRRDGGGRGGVVASGARNAYNHHNQHAGTPSGSSRHPTTPQVANQHNVQSVQLSKVAQFDDMVRYTNSLLAMNEETEAKLIEALHLIKGLRAENIGLRQERAELEKARESERDNNSASQNAIKNLRHRLNKEMSDREEVDKKYGQLRRQMSAVKALLSEQYPNGAPPHINLRDLSLIDEDIEQGESMNASSISSEEWDKTDENLDRSGHQRSGRRSGSTGANRRKSGPRNSDYNHNPVDYTQGIGNHQFMGATSPKKQCTVMDMPPPPPPGPIIPPAMPSAPMDEDRPVRTQSSARPWTRSQVMSTNTGSKTSVTPTTLSRAASLKDKGHTLVAKTNFVARECCVCSKRIGFCQKYLVCSDCNRHAHPECKESLPKPCVAFVSARDVRQKGQKTCLQIYVPKNTRPAIPAIVHVLTAEIEKRGIKEKGIYRIGAADSEVARTKEAILRGKFSQSELSRADVHVLATALKRFFRDDIDEPLITFLLWRDFVTAADKQDERLRMQLLTAAINEMPAANRDTLVHLINHIRKMSNQHTHMSLDSLAKVWAPTLVGHSMLSPPSHVLMAENPKQQAVMTALLKLPDEFWDAFESVDPALNHLDSPPANRRAASASASHVGRLMGAQISSASLTPLSKGLGSQAGKTLRPLF